MRLIGIDCQIPSNKISNEDIVEMVKFYSNSHSNVPLQKLEIVLRRFLKLTGSNTRFWRSEKEKPVDLLNQAVNRALRMAGIEKKEIKLVIYSGIDRGFIEPSNASFLCNALGMPNVRCFDIVDACMGWSSAVQTAYAFFKADESLEYIMLLNAEFPMDKKGTVLPNNFIISEIKELDWKAPSFTLGEAASACIFKRDDSVAIQFAFIENSAFAQMCSIPLINFEKYLTDSDLIAQPEMRFYANGADLLEMGMKPSCDVLKELLEKLDYVPKIVFPHSVSEKIIQQAFDNMDLALTPYSTFSELGNVATVSIPSAITKTLLNGNIMKGDKCIAWVASAGMKFSAIEISL
jgi:acyl-CoA:acyl-CoA alkyltransferase